MLGSFSLVLVQITRQTGKHIVFTMVKDYYTDVNTSSANSKVGTTLAQNQYFSGMATQNLTYTQVHLDGIFSFVTHRCPQITT